MKARLMAAVVTMAIALVILAAGFQLGVKSVSLSPSQAIEMSGFILNGKPAPKPVMM